MFAAGMALALLAALILDLTGHGHAISGLFTAAGLVFLVLALIFPYPRRPWRLPVR